MIKNNSIIYFVTIIITIIIIRVNAIIVHNNNNNNNNSNNNNETIELYSLYSTIGLRPDISLYYNITFLSKDNIDNCEIINIDYSLLYDHFIIFIDDVFQLDLFRTCVTDEFANGIFFANLLQQIKVKGIITRITEGEQQVRFNYNSSPTYMKGRITGFTDIITIPFLVTYSSVIDYLINNANNISFIELTPIPSNDRQVLELADNTWKSMVIVNIVLYAILTVMLSCMICSDIELMWRQKQIKTRSMIAKVSAFLTTLCGLIWFSVDPFSYKLMSKFPSIFFLHMHIGTAFIVFYIILKIWVKATGTKFNSKKHLWIVLGAIYSLAAITLLVTIINAVVWYNNAVRTTYNLISITSIVLCGCGYVYFGKSIVTILCRSGNSSAGPTILSAKIIVFIASFVVFGFVAVIVYQSGVLGGVIGQMFNEIVIWFGLFATFLVLFFNRGNYRRHESYTHKKAVPSSPPPTPPLTPTTSSPVTTITISLESGSDSITNSTN